MPYRVSIAPLAERKMQNYLQGNDTILIEAHLRLRGELAEGGPSVMERRRGDPFDGMVYQFSLIDPDNRLCQHVCVFHVVYSQDETTLRVVGFGYLRSFGV